MKVHLWKKQWVLVAWVLCILREEVHHLGVSLAWEDYFPVLLAGKKNCIFGGLEVHVLTDCLAMSSVGFDCNN